MHDSTYELFNYNKINRIITHVTQSDNHIKIYNKRKIRKILLIDVDTNSKNLISIDIVILFNVVGWQVQNIN